MEADDDLLASLTDEEWRFAWGGRWAVFSGATSSKALVFHTKLPAEAIARLRPALLRVTKTRSFEAAIRRLFGQDWSPVRRSVHGELDGTAWRALLERYGNACAYCGSADRPLERDHVIPLARRGRFGWENVVPSCRSCNARKARRLLSESGMTLRVGNSDALTVGNSDAENELILN